MGGRSPATVENVDSGSGDPFAGLRYPPFPRGTRPRAVPRLAASVLLVAAAVFTASLVIEELTSATARPDRWLFVLFWGFTCILATGLAVLAFRIRAFQVRDGVVTLVMPKRKVSGGRIRDVPLKDVARAERITQPGADPGILLTLRDGTRLPIFEADVPGAGSPFLDRIAAAVERNNRRPQG